MAAISIDASDLKRLIRQIDRMQAKLPPAIARGLNEGGDKVRTQTQARPDASRQGSSATQASPRERARRAPSLAA